MYYSSIHYVTVRNLCKISLISLNLFCGSPLLALPELNQVVAGATNIVADGRNSLQINQNTDKAILNWNSFNINVNEKVHFQQPQNGVCLNRIDSTNGMSQIAGTMSSTAKIILVNQAGILFNDTAQVNVGGIIASVADVTNENFLQSELLNFDQASELQGSIINKGVINVKVVGLTALLGTSVSNSGIILAKYSNVQVKSGSKFVVDLYGNGVINFESTLAIPEPTTNAGLDENSHKLPNAIDNAGKIIADGGNVIIMASAAADIFDNLINMSGEIQAQTVTQKDTGVILIGDVHGKINVSGKIDVNGNALDLLGGNIVMVSEQINIDEAAVLDVSGELGSGWIVLGNASGEIKSFNSDSDKSYIGTHYTLSNENLIPTEIVAGATRTFYDYKKHATFTLPIANISINQPHGSNKRNVNIDVNYNGTKLNLRAINAEDHVLVQNFLNSQPLVRNKYAHKRTLDAAATEARVKVLSDRFEQTGTDGFFMHGGFIITDKDNGQFLGMINSGTSLQPGVVEIAFMIRPDAWSQKPKNLSAEYNVPKNEFLDKEYSGVCTAAVSSIQQYTEQLIKNEHTILGEPIIAMRGDAMVDNPGAWKAMAKNDFNLKQVRINTEYGQDLRYRLEHEF